MAENGMSVIRYDGSVKNWFTMVTVIMSNIGGGGCNKHIRESTKVLLIYCDALEIFKLLTGGVDNQPPRTCLLEKLNKKSMWKKCNERKGKSWNESKERVFNSKINEHCLSGLKISVYQYFGIGSTICSNLICNEGVVNIAEGGICGSCGETCEKSKCVIPRKDNCLDINTQTCTKKLQSNSRMCFLPGGGKFCCATCLRYIHVPMYLADTPYFNALGQESYKNNTSWRIYRCFSCNSSDIKCSNLDSYKHSFEKCTGGCWTKRTVRDSGNFDIYERGCLSNKLNIIEGQCIKRWIKLDNAEVYMSCCQEDLCNIYMETNITEKKDLNSFIRQTSILMAYMLITSLIGIKVIMVVKKGRYNNIWIQTSAVGKSCVPELTLADKPRCDVDPMEELANMLYAVQPNTIEMGNEVQAALEIQRDNIRAKLAARLVKEERDNKVKKDNPSDPTSLIVSTNSQKKVEGSIDTYTEPGTLEQYYT